MNFIKGKLAAYGNRQAPASKYSYGGPRREIIRVDNNGLVTLSGNSSTRSHPSGYGRYRVPSRTTYYNWTTRFCIADIRSISNHNQYHRYKPYSTQSVTLNCQTSKCVESRTRSSSTSVNYYTSISISMKPNARQAEKLVRALTHLRQLAAQRGRACNIRKGGELF